MNKKNNLELAFDQNKHLIEKFRNKELKLDSKYYIKLEFEDFSLSYDLGLN